MARHNSGKHYVKAAKKAGLKVKNGKGDHKKIYSPNGEKVRGRSMMVVPLHRELANGTESAIRKWFAGLGILVALASFCYLASLIQMIP